MQEAKIIIISITILTLQNVVIPKQRDSRGTRVSIVFLRGTV